MANHGPPRHPMALHPAGGSPEGTAHLGPQIRKAGGFMGGAGEGYARGLDRIAVSPDGKFIYYVQNFTESKRFQKKLRHGVYRVKWNDKTADALWVGQDEPGDDDQFNEPAGIAVDHDGRVFVCDRGNDRVKVFSPAGKRLGQFACPLPEQIEIHPKSGEFAILSREADRRAEHGTLFRFSPWGKEPPRQLAKLEVEGLNCLTLDPTADAMRLWITHATGYKRPDALVPVTLNGNGEFQLGENVNRPNSLHCPSFLVADPDRKRVLIYEHLNLYARQGHKSIDIETGEVKQLNSNGSDLALDADGNFYVMGRYNANSMSRYDPDFNRCRSKAPTPTRLS